MRWINALILCTILAVFFIGCSFSTEFLIVNKSKHKIQVYYKIKPVEKNWVFYFNGRPPAIEKFEMEGEKRVRVSFDETGSRWKIDSIQQSYSVELDTMELINIGGISGPFVKDENQPYYHVLNISEIRISSSDSSFLEAKNELVQMIFTEIGQHEFGFIVE